MKRAGKVFRYLLIAFFSILLLLIVIAWAAEDKIVRLALDQVSKSTNIPIEVEEVEFSLIHDFPLATLQCNQLWVGTPENGKEQDTLLFVGKMYFSVETPALLKGIFNARKIELEDGELFYSVDSLGRSNIDFLLEDDESEVVDTTVNAIFLDIDELRLENIQCYYRDEKLKARALLGLQKVEMNGLINDQEYRGKIEGEALLTQCAFDTTKLDQMQQAQLEFLVKYEDELATIDEFTVLIDEHVRMQAKGSIDLKSNLQTAISLDGELTDLASLLKYLPDNLLQDYSISQLGGSVNLSADIMGALGDSVLPRIDARFELADGQLKYDNYPLLRELNVKGIFSNGDQQNNSSSSLEIQQASVSVESSKASLTATLKDFDRLNYTLKSNLDLNLADFAPFVPAGQLASLSGKVNMQLSTRGRMPDSIDSKFVNSMMNNSTLTAKIQQLDARMDSTLSVSNANGTVYYTPNHLRMDSISMRVPEYFITLKNLQGDAGFSGDYMDPKSLSIVLNSLDVATDSSSFSLQGEIQNLLQPLYVLNGKLDLNLADVAAYIPDSLFHSLTGTASGSFHSKATVDPETIGDQFMDVLFDKSSFELKLAGFNSQAADSMMSCTNLNASLSYAADSMWVDYFNGNYLGLDFSADSTSILNLYSAALLNEEKELQVHGNFSLGDFSYAWMSGFIKEDSTVVENPNHDELAEPMKFTYKVNGRIKAKSIQYENSLFQNIDSKFLVKENHYVFDSLSMNAFDGSALSSVRIEMKENDEMQMYFKTNVKKMNVSEMVDSFHEYLVYADMGDITGENVKGLLSTQMDGKIVLKNFEPVYESLLLNGDLNLENGAMINVTPVMEVGKIPGIGLKNLDKLYFSKLSSNLFLFKNELYIPKTEIRSTSFDAMFLGMYSFGEDYAYHIRMFLGEVLSSKSKSNLKKQAQDGGFEEDADDVTKGRTSIYLVSKSEDGKEKAWFDKRKDRNNMVAKVSLRKQMVEMLFHPKLVSYDVEN